jgi:hypothetical protein
MNEAYKNLFDGVLNGSVNLEKFLSIENDLLHKNQSENYNLFQNLGINIDYSYTDENGDNLIFHAITSAIKYNTTELVDHIIDFHKGSINRINNGGFSVLYHLINEIKKNNCLLTDVEFYMYRELIDHVDKDVLLNNTMKLCEFIIDTFKLSDTIINNFITPLAYKCQLYTYCHYKLNKITYRLHTHKYAIDKFLNSYLSYVNSIKLSDQHLFIKETIKKKGLVDPIYIHKINNKNTNNMLLMAVKDILGEKSLTLYIGTLKSNRINVAKQITPITFETGKNEHHLIKHNNQPHLICNDRKMYKISYSDNKILSEDVSNDDEPTPKKNNLLKFGILETDCQNIVQPINLKKYNYHNVKSDKLSIYTLKINESYNDIKISIASIFIRIIKFNDEQIVLISDKFYPIIKNDANKHNLLTTPYSLVLSDKYIVVSYKEGDVLSFNKKNILMMTHHRLDKININEIKCIPLIYSSSNSKTLVPLHGSL